MSELNEQQKSEVIKFLGKDITMNELELMALSGDVDAMYRMGWYHSNGLHGAINKETHNFALNWYKKASEHCDSEAMWRLAACYENRVANEWSVDEDDDTLRAYVWSYLAHEAGGKNFNEDECEEIDWKAINERIVEGSKKALTPEQLVKAEKLIYDLRVLIVENIKEEMGEDIFDKPDKEEE